MSSVLIVGAGGFGRETREIVHALADAGHPIRLLGFLDDDPALAGTTIGGVPVVGTIQAVADHPDALVVITTGHPGNYFTRAEIARRLALPAERYATLVHPAATVPQSAAVGPGSIIHAGVVLTADVSVGSHVVVMPSVTLTHDDRVGDYVTLGAGARVAGRVTIGDGAYIGSGALIREDLSVGEWSLVGMGSVVVDDVPPSEVWAGNPARKLRDVLR